MKKKILTLFTILLIILIGYSLINYQSTNPPPVKPPKTNKINQNQIDLQIANQTFTAAWLEVNDPSKILLIPNFTEKETASAVIDQHNCTGLTNGGFYLQDSSFQNSPIGLFVTDNKEISKAQPNLLLNGFFKVTKDNTPLITIDTPSDSLRLALQSGPILFQDGLPIKLSILNDKPSRRVIVGQRNKIYFIAFFDPTSVYLGPNLNDLPQLIKMFTQKTGIEIQNALNLDGGAASVFHTTDLSLPELSPVGSFFCITK